MSVVIAIKKDGVIYMGADTQFKKGGQKVILKHPSNYRIWKVKGAEDCLMAGAGKHAEICAIKNTYGLVRDVDLFKKEVDFKYIVNRVEPLIRDTLMERQLISSDKPYEDIVSDFIAVANNRMYEIKCGCVIEHEDFIVIGDNSKEAIGNLLATKYERNPIARIIKAMNACNERGINVGFPIVTIDSQNNNFVTYTLEQAQKFLHN